MKSNETDDEIHVSIRFLSETNSPEQLRQLFGPRVGKSWCKGEANRLGRVHEFNGFEIALAKDSGYEIDDKISRLLDLIEPVRESIVAIDWFVQISCVVYFSSAFPAVNLSTKLIKRIADVGASLDFDVYPI